ncbi:MAG: Xaa-Pro peptidase family protein [Spirochaetes bacterium]|nr:Xaa-Pro peptidase family protein [Spirochaetota bacterium]
MITRLEKLKRNLAKKDAFPYFVANIINVGYLTGFKGTYGNLLIDRDRTIFITDPRYEEYAGTVLPDSVELFVQRQNLFLTIKDALKSIRQKKLHFEPLISVASFNAIKKDLNGIRLIAAEDEVSPIRATKDTGEIEIIKKAVAIADGCFNHLLNIVKPGMLEWDISLEIENYYRKNGCRKSSFDTIAASGKGSSMPHYSTSMTKRVEHGDMLMIDMGCEYNGYNSDLTRTVFIGKITPEFKKIYDIVKTAQTSAIEAVRAGVTAGALDRVARKVIEDKGYGGCFGHGLGHGIGLEVHEMPSLKTGSRYRIKKDTVFTIEPGIYIPESGGIRIEDVVRATGSGCEVLTGSSKDVIII